MAEKRPSELLDPLDAHRRLTTKEVMALIGVKSKNTLWKRVREGKVPRPRYQAPRQPRWILGEVVDALAEAERPARQGRRDVRTLHRRSCSALGWGNRSTTGAEINPVWLSLLVSK